MALCKVSYAVMALRSLNSVLRLGVHPQQMIPSDNSFFVLGEAKAS